MSRLLRFLRSDVPRPNPDVVAPPPRPVAGHHAREADFLPLVQAREALERRALAELEQQGGIPRLLGRHGPDWEHELLAEWVRKRSSQAEVWRIRKELAIAHGLTPIAEARDRDVYALDEDQVVKIALHEFGRTANLREAQRWSRLGVAAAASLAPVIARAEGGEWLVMVRAQPLTYDHESPPPAQIHREVRAEVADFSPANWGRLGGRIVLLDYGGGRWSGAMYH